MNARSVFAPMLAMLLAAAAGCGRHPAESRSDFDIPPSLVFRMYGAHNAARDRTSGIEGSFDGEEMMALMMQGFAAAPEIASRPRGAMSFADDGLTDEQREAFWPFDVEGFEATLEARLERDENGLFRLEDGDGDLLPSNPTIRLINREIETWAIERLDAAFERVDAETYAEVMGPEENPEESPAWLIRDNGGEAEYFSIKRSDGAWEGREYAFLLQDGGENPFCLAEFDSFPNRKEAAAARLCRMDPRSLNNLAVLWWRHRIFRLMLDPGQIRFLLAKASEAGVAQAGENLAVLMEHIPESEEAPDSGEDASRGD